MLTDKNIRSAKPAAKAYRLADGQGLFVFIPPTGSKLWRLRYEFQGKEKTLTFGPYPAVSLAEARAERDAAKKVLRKGRDPAIEKKLVLAMAGGDATKTFETVARSWHASRTSTWSEQHAKQVLKSLEADAFPALGQFQVGDITAPIVLATLRTVEARGAIEQAHRVRQRMSEVFVFAIGSGMAETDPAAIVAPALRKVIKGQQPAITDLAEARKMLQAVEAEDAYPLTLLALRLLLLTALRPGEVRAARWEEFEGLDGPAPLWRVPSERMKMKREHLVPLSRQAVETIAAVRPFTGRKPILFPNVRRPDEPMSLNAMGYLLNRAGYLHRHVPHGFRSTFSTVMNERFQADHAVIETMLAHVPDNKVAGAYNRSLYLERRRELAQAWADLILVGLKPLDQLVAGKRKAG